MDAAPEVRPICKQKNRGTFIVNMIQCGYHEEYCGAPSLMGLTARSSSSTDAQTARCGPSSPCCRPPAGPRTSHPVPESCAPCPSKLRRERRCHQARFQPPPHRAARARGVWVESPCCCCCCCCYCCSCCSCCCPPRPPLHHPRSRRCLQSGRGGSATQRQAQRTDSRCCRSRSAAHARAAPTSVRPNRRCCSAQRTSLPAVRLEPSCARAAQRSGCGKSLCTWRTQAHRSAWPLPLPCRLGVRSQWVP